MMLNLSAEGAGGTLQEEGIGLSGSPVLVFFLLAFLCIAAVPSVPPTSTVSPQTHNLSLVTTSH